MSYIGEKSNSRVKWQISPVTKVKDSKKKYDRKSEKNKIRKELREQ